VADDDLRELEAALAAAWRPVEIDAERHEAILASVLGSAETEQTQELLVAAWKPAAIDADRHEAILASVLGSSEADRTAELLAAAWRPASLEPARHEAILARVLVERELADEPPPTAEEIAESQRLRDALEGKGSHALADLAGDLRAASKPARVDRHAHGRIVDKTREARVVSLADRRVANRRRAGAVAGVVGSALALAAGFLLFVQSKPAQEPDAVVVRRTQGDERAVAVADEVAVDLGSSRSTMELFDEPFEPKGGESQRMERITASRAANYRQARFAAWGVAPR
jgi:hypothetical protein